MNKENLQLDKYQKITMKPSQYAKGEMVIDNVEIICPSCKTIGPSIDHFGERQCLSCRLNMQVHGNNLTIWR